MRIGITTFLLKSAAEQLVHERNIFDINLLDIVLEKFEQDKLSRRLEPNIGAISSEIFAINSISIFEYAVPDTLCLQSLIGEYTLAGLQQCLKGRGFKVELRDEINDFRFGNAGVVRSEKVAKFPLKFGSVRADIQAAILPKGGSPAPLMLSKVILYIRESIGFTIRE